MLCHLPAPYPDELLYSDLARYLTYIGAKSAVSTIDHLFGHRIAATVDLPGSLNIVAERTWLIWRMTGEEIANRLTLFPYYSRYLPTSIVEKSLQSHLSHKKSSSSLQLSINCYQVKFPKFLRFCPVCRESDLSIYGETYWRRSHQLAGVLVCPEHGQPLIDSKAPMRPFSTYHFADATVNTFDVQSNSEESLNNDDLAKAFTIAKRLKDMLSGSVNLWNPHDINKTYRSAAMERRLGKNSSISLSQVELESSFIAFYGDSLLSKLNCAVELKKRNSWLHKIFSSNHRFTAHPLQHALVQIFLESIPIKPMPTGVGPWKCPNPYAVHKEQFPIANLIRVYFSKTKGIITAVARCSCGFHFVFTSTADDDPHLPIVKRIVAHGPTWVTEAQRLKNSGLGTWAIIKKMGIQHYQLKHFLAGKQNSIYIGPEQIAKWREEWSKLVNGVPNRSRNMARKINPKLYIRLFRYDREWLQKEPTIRSHRSSHAPWLNWTDRDMQWSQALKAAATKIMQVIPERRASQRAICREAGVSVMTVRRKESFLPQCSSVLSECCESSENYRARLRLRRTTSRVRDKKLLIGS